MKENRLLAPSINIKIQIETNAPNSPPAEKGTSGYALTSCRRAQGREGQHKPTLYGKAITLFLYANVKS